MSINPKWTVIALLLGGILCPQFALGEDIVETHRDAAIRGRVSIVIDDLGYSLAPAKALLALPFDVTLAVIPFTPYGEQLANLATTENKEVMLHTPMEPMNQDRWEQGLHAGMSREETIATINAMLRNIPNALGINNHGGSKLTQDRKRMDWIMLELRRHGLYFVDSRTIASSVAIDSALEAQIEHKSRDIFLDNERDTAAIQRQFEKLRDLALEKGEALAIGHPYPETLSVLPHALFSLRRQGIEVISVSKLIEKHSHFPILLTSSQEDSNASM